MLPALKNLLAIVHAALVTVAHLIETLATVAVAIMPARLTVALATAQHLVKNHMPATTSLAADSAVKAVLTAVPLHLHIVKAIAQQAAVKAVAHHVTLPVQVMAHHVAHVVLHNY